MLTVVVVIVLRIIRDRREVENKDHIQDLEQNPIQSIQDIEILVNKIDLVRDHHQEEHHEFLIGTEIVEIKKDILVIENIDKI